MESVLQREPTYNTLYLSNMHIHAYAMCVYVDWLIGRSSYRTPSIMITSRK